MTLIICPGIMTGMVFFSILSWETEREIAATCIGAAILTFTIWLSNLLTWHVRLHARLMSEELRKSVETSSG